MELSVQKREKLGKASRTLRGEGLILAEVYGRGLKNEHVTIKANDFLKVFSEAGENTIINLNLGNESWPAIVFDVQKDYLSGRVAHVDFYRVTMTEKIKAKVPLEFVGEAPAAKEKKGILNKSITEVEVEALPGDLPHRLEVDLGALAEVDQSIYARDLKVPVKVKILVDPETVVATIVAVKEEEVPAGPTDVSEVKVETEEKKAGREKEKEQSSS